MTNKVFNRKLQVLAILTTVGFGFLQGARLLDLNSGPYSPQPYALLGLSADGFTFLIVAVYSYFGRIVEVRPLFFLGIAASAIYGLLIVSGNQSASVLILMQIAAGMGWSLIIICWMDVFARYRPLYSLIMIAVAYGLDTLIQPLSSTLFQDYRQIVLLVVFVVSVVFLHLCIRENHYVAQEMKEPVSPKTSLAEAFSRARRAVVGAFIFSFICGVFIQLDINSDLQYAQTDLTAILSVGVALIMCLVLVVIKLKKANINYISPIAALCLASILFYRSFDGSDDYLVGALMTTFLMSFYVLLWLTFVSEAYERKLPAFFLLGLALGVARLSVAAGRFFADTIIEPLQIDIHVVILGCIWALVVVVSLIFAFYLHHQSKHLFTETPKGLDGQFDSTAVEKDTGEAALQLLKKTYTLSEREIEMVKEFSAGRSARYIADYFVLSEHTVKTYLRRSYMKMNIHSRQELLDLIEEMESKLLRG